MAVGGCFVKQPLPQGLAVNVAGLQVCGAMTDSKPETSREDRLAARLRENLKRRKAQARALDADGESTPSPESGLSNSDT